MVEGEELESAKLSEEEESLPVIEQIEPLIVEEPTEKQIFSLLQTWLEGKSQLLSGNESQSILTVARGTLIKRVIEEREKDKALGQIQDIEAKITSLEIQSRTKKRIQVKSELTYFDRLFDTSGKLISETNIPNTPFIDKIFLISSFEVSFLSVNSFGPDNETFFPGKNFSEFGFGVFNV